MLDETMLPHLDSRKPDPDGARQIARPDGNAIEVKTEASILPIKKRPRLAVRIFSSN